MQSMATISYVVAEKRERVHTYIHTDRQTHDQSLFGAPKHGKGFAIAQPINKVMADDYKVMAEDYKVKYEYYKSKCMRIQQELSELKKE